MFRKADRTKLELMDGYVFAHGAAVSHRLDAIEQAQGKLLAALNEENENFDILEGTLRSIQAGLIGLMDDNRVRFHDLHAKLDAMNAAADERIAYFNKLIKANSEAPDPFAILSAKLDGIRDGLAGEIAGLRRAVGLDLAEIRNLVVRPAKRKKGAKR